MSEVALQAVLKRLEEVAARLEKLETAGGSGSSAPVQAGEVAAWVNEFDDLINTRITPLVALTAKLGNNELKAQVDFLQKAVAEQRTLLATASQSKKPDDTTLGQLLKPTSDFLTKAVETRDKARGNALWNHLSAISEGIPALGWVAVSPTPGPYVHEYKGNAEFYSNKILKDFKGKDQDQVDWANNWSGFLGDLQAYVKKNHTTALTWNPRGGDAKSANVSAPAAPAAGPPPPAAPAPTTTAPAKSADPSALFASLNKGGDITQGLKKVTKDMKTSNRTDKSSFVPAEASKPAAAAASKKPAVKKGPAKFELNGNKWEVENQDNNKSIVIEGAESKHVVFIYGCDNSVIQIKDKVNAISVANCKKTAIVFHNAISSFEAVNSTGIEVQVLGNVPSFTIDKCSGVQLILSKDCLNAEIVSAKSDAMNVIIPGGEDIIEMAIPEQFKTVITNNKLVTTNVEHV